MESVLRMKVIGLKYLDGFENFDFGEMLSANVGDGQTSLQDPVALSANPVIH